MASLDYAVDESVKRFRLYFNLENPVENGLANMILLSLKPFAHKIPNTNLLCVEIALNDEMLSKYKNYINNAEISAIKNTKNKTSKKKRKPT